MDGTEPERRRAVWVWATGFLLILLVHFLWTSLNGRPAVWDMAYHQVKGWDFLRAWGRGDYWGSFRSLSSYYPPLYYLQEAAVLKLFGDTRFLTPLANLLGLFLTSFCTFRIALRCFSPLAAACAGLLPCLFPLAAWTSREALLDVPLAGFVALALLLVLKSDFFQRKGTTLAFGLVAGLGVLTKWTFALFLLVPSLYFLARPARRRAAVNLLDASFLALPLGFIWYLPNLQRLWQNLQGTLQASRWERDPAAASLLGWIYYPRCLAGYYLFLPLTALFAFSLYWSLRGWRRLDPVLRFLWVTLAAAILLLTLLATKDPRYILPAVCPLAVVLLSPWHKSEKFVLLLTGFAMLQFLSISFALPGRPPKIAFFEIPGDRDFHSMRQEWVLYEPDYFGIAGPPRRQDWHYRQILGALPAGARVGFVPETPYFQTEALSLEAAREGKELSLFRLGQSSADRQQLSRLGWVIGKSGEQGISYLTRYNQSLYGLLEQQGWRLAGRWPLPDGSQAFLWRNPGR